MTGWQDGFPVGIVAVLTLELLTWLGVVWPEVRRGRRLRKAQRRARAMRLARNC